MNPILDFHAPRFSPAGGVSSATMGWVDERRVKP